MITARRPAEAKTLMESADIIQLEWWHHPLMAEWMHEVSGLSCRLAVWSHVSGLHYPAFPPGLPALPHVFMTTTAASGNFGRLVASSGGFGEPPARHPVMKDSLRYGYIGSLNEAKLHPRIMDFLAAAGSDFRMTFYGDTEVTTPLIPASNVQLMGYTEQPAEALADMDVFIYLLNPLHYGTTENALLEAMAASVVPIVMNNPVESAIVQHGKTGWVVDSPEAFAKAVRYLETHSAERNRMAQAAAEDVRRRFSLESTVAGLTHAYRDVMRQPPKIFDFRPLLGESPFDWFCAGLGKYAPLFAEGAEKAGRQERRTLPFLYEKSKSSLFHFLRYFPQDERLRHWAGILEDDLAETQKEIRHGT